MIITVALGILVCLCLSAFCSSAEMAYSSCNVVRLENMRDDGSKRAGIAVKITEKFDDALSAILIGFITVLMLVLVLSGWGYQRYQQHQRKKRPSIDLDLPSLLESPRLPMDALPIPAN